MTWLPRLLRPRPSRDEIDAELQDHLERLAADYRQQGIPPDQALRQARLAFGGSVSLREQCREARTRHYLDRLVRWARDVTRATRRDPLVTVVCIVTLALGIGATTAVATLVDALLLRPLPYANADRLVELWTGSTSDPTVRQPGLDPTLLPDLRRALDSMVTQVEGYQYGTATMTGHGDPQTVSAPRITPGLLTLLGIVPRLGRLLGPTDVAEARQVVIGEALWVSRFGADPSIIGTSIMLDGEPHIVVGVMPKSLQFPWQPAVLWRTLPVDARPDRTQGVALLRDGISRSQVDDRLGALSTHLREQGLLAADQRILFLEPVQQRQASRHRVALSVMLAAVVLVLVVACINVSSLLLARASSRASELALRATLGARRRTLTSRAFGEGLVLAGGGTIAGLLLARLLIDVCVNRLPDDFRFMNLEALGDSTMFWWALGASATTAIGTSLLPALQAGLGSAAVVNAAAPAARAGQDNRWQSRLVIVQLAVVLVVLSASGLLLRSFVALASVPLGYDVEHLTVVSLQLPRHRYPTGQRHFAFMHELAARMAELPRTRAVTFAEGAPPSGSSFHIEAQLEFDGVVRGTATELPTVTVMPEYFSTLGIKLVDGRTFTSDDSDRSVVISETLARRYWGTTSPIGRQFRWTSQVPQHVVVGVAADAKHGGLDDAIGGGLAMYLPYRQGETWPYVSFLLRGDGQDVSKQDLRTIVAAMDPDLPVSIETMDERLATSVARQRFLVLLASGFAGIGVLLAAVGIFGNAAYWIARRKRELALRMSVGASPASIRRFVLARGVRLAVMGTAIGLVGIAATGRAIESLLFGIHRYDPWTLLAVVGLLAAIVVLAAYVPARRAGRLEPWTILQE